MDHFRWVPHWSPTSTCLLLRAVPQQYHLLRLLLCAVRSRQAEGLPVGSHESRDEVAGSHKGLHHGMQGAPYRVDLNQTTAARFRTHENGN